MLNYVPVNGETNPSRCLMLLHRSRIAISLILQHIGRQARIKIVSGSKFAADLHSNTYNLKTLRQVKDLVAQGYLLILDDVNNTVQTSLYDLLNKFYSRCNGRLYFRISLGANHSPRCLLHPAFNAVMLVE